MSIPDPEQPMRDLKRRAAERIEEQSRAEERRREERGILAYGLSIFGLLLVAIVVFAIYKGGSVPIGVAMAVVGVVLFVSGLRILWGNRRSE